MAFSALWSVIILSMISTSCSEVTLLSLAAENTIHVVEDESIRVNCSSSSIEGPQILQINNNIEDNGFSRITVLNDSNPDTPGTVYQFADVVRDDNGTLFQCFVNAVPSNYLTLVVDFPPKYFPDASYFVVIEGTPLRVEFRLDALRAITTFNWTKEGSDFQSNNRITLGANYINFGQVEREDAGNYKVTAQDGVGLGSASLTLDVYYPPEFEAGRQVVNRSFIAGNDLLLDCALSSNPSSNLSLSVLDVAVTENIQQSPTQFGIKTAVTGNEGYYICTAENAIAITQLIYNIIIGDLPDVVVEIDVSLTTEAVTLRVTYTETNTEHPVIRFYITVASSTLIARPESLTFSVSLSYDGLEPGTTYIVTVIAENIIGNSTAQTPQTFTVPENMVISGVAGNVACTGILLLTMLVALSL